MWYLPTSLPVFHPFLPIMIMGLCSGWSYLECTTPCLFKSQLPCKKALYQVWSMNHLIKNYLGCFLKCRFFGPIADKLNQNLWKGSPRWWILNKLLKWFWCPLSTNHTEKVWCQVKSAFRVNQSGDFTLSHLHWELCMTCNGLAKDPSPARTVALHRVWAISLEKSPRVMA